MNLDRQQILVAVARELRLHDAQRLDLDARAERLTTLFRGLYNIAVPDPTPERNAPRWNLKLGEGQFEDPAERLLRHQAYQAYDGWRNLRDKRDKWATDEVALWDRFERLEAAADLLEQARGGGPQPGDTVTWRADTLTTAEQAYAESRRTLTESRGDSEHVLYATGDRMIPRQLLDQNGEVVLQMCKRCGAAEAELALGKPCPGEPEDLDWRGE